MSGLGRVSAEDREKGLRRARKRAASRRLTVDDMLGDIVVLLKQLRTIEHLQDRDAIDEIRKRYDQEGF